MTIKQLYELALQISSTTWREEVFADNEITILVEACNKLKKTDIEKFPVLKNAVAYFESCQNIDQEYYASFSAVIIAEIERLYPLTRGQGWAVYRQKQCANGINQNDELTESYIANIELGEMPIDACKNELQIFEALQHSYAIPLVDGSINYQISKSGNEIFIRRNLQDGGSEPYYRLIKERRNYG